MQALAEYAKIVQDNNMVPMVEPEVLMDGDHSIDRCYEVSSAALKSLFAAMEYGREMQFFDGHNSLSASGHLLAEMLMPSA